MTDADPGAYADEALAGLYDALNPWGPSDDFYLPYVLAAGSVVDVGCGTGTLLCAARAAGHRGVLYGVDPAAGVGGVDAGPYAHRRPLGRGRCRGDVRGRADRAA